MKSFLLLFITFIVPFCTSAQTQQIKEPIYLLNTLMACTSEDEMKDICTFYGFTENPNEDGYCSYTYSDGTTILFKMKNNGIYKEGGDRNRNTN